MPISWLVDTQSMAHRAVERSSVKKEQNICYGKEEPQEHATGKKLDANDHTSYD